MRDAPLESTFAGLLLRYANRKGDTVKEAITAPSALLGWLVQVNRVVAC